MAGMARDAGLDPRTMELVDADQYLPQKTPFFGVRQKEFPTRRLVPRYDQIPVSEEEINWKKWRKAVRSMMTAMMKEEWMIHKIEVEAEGREADSMDSQPREDSRSEAITGGRTDILPEVAIEA